VSVAFTQQVESCCVPRCGMGGGGVDDDMQWVLWCIAALMRVRVHLACCVGGHMQVVTFTMT
jgi:hypothetical protein